MAKQKAHVPKIATAREKLNPSKLKQTQLELLGQDIDVSDLYLALNHKDINIGEAITDITIDRTIEGASTVTVEVFDRDRALLRSGRLSAKNDTEIDGLYFRLKAVRKNGDNLELTFEDREVAVLRTYAKPIKQSPKTSRGRVTRAQFILRMIKEVKEFKIPYVIPELNVVQPIAGQTQVPPTLQQTQQRGYGIPKTNNLTVKYNSDGSGVKMDENQRQIANTILLTAQSHLLPRPVMVMAIMCGIQESTLSNPLAYPANLRGAIAYSSTNPLMNPCGVYQQIALLPTGYTNWPASRDVAVDSWGTADGSKKGFMQICAQVFHQYPHMAYGDIIERVQHSGLNGQSTYGRWRTQAERIVDGFGSISGTAASVNAQFDANTTAATFEFYRGQTPTGKLNKQKYGGKWGPESSWDCIQRLARDVQWRAFFVSGTFYYVAEDELFRSQPIATITEDMDGVISLDGDYDENSKVATLNLACQMNRWAAPPGSIVQVVDMGPWNGRWLVNDVSKSLFSEQGTITLKKPMPRLPEQSGGNIVNQGAQSSWTQSPIPPPQGTGSTKVPLGNAAWLAQELLRYHDIGRWTDDNGNGLDQIRKTAANMMVSSQDPAVGQCYIQADPIRAVLWLIKMGYKIGTYAWCSDHHNDGEHGHAGGWAVDIDRIDGLFIGSTNTAQMFKLVRQVDELFNNSKGIIRPRQLISGGYGNHRDLTLSALSIPGSDSFYGSKTMGEHCNHIHVGYGVRKNDGTYQWPGA